MANPVNTSLQIQSRNNSKKAMADLSRGKVKTGKETVREGIKKETEKSARRHSAIMKKFVSEEGKGSSINFNL